jgi:carboxymethylenebutenolidase
MPITQRTIRIETPQGGGMPCYIAVPESGDGPGLLLLHDIHGLTDHDKHLANLHAEEGWVVAVPDLYWRQGGAVVFALDADGTARAGEMAAGINDSRAVRDADAAFSALAALSETGAECGVVGYGLGGRIALMLAARDHRVRCAIAYYPREFDSCAGILSGVSCAGVIHLARDQAVPAAAGTLAVHGYAADTGFDNPNLAAFDRSAHGLAKSRSLAALRGALGPVYDLAQLWEAHLHSEFAERDVDVSMATMVDEPYVLVVPTVTGGTGKKHLRRWYSNHFHFQNPADTTIIPISRTVGSDRLVDEFVFCFTHDRVMDWILPDVAPTGKYLEVPMIAVVNFRGAKLYHEHIWWDQATVLVQAGLLDPSGLPVTGIEQARAIQDEELPRNRLISGW